MAKSNKQGEGKRKKSKTESVGIIELHAHIERGSDYLKERKCTESRKTREDRERERERWKSEAQQYQMFR